MKEPTYLTPDGAERLRAELKELTGPKREELAARLRSAIQMGDLSENADYHKAKEDQGFLEGRIQELEYLLGNAVIIEENGNKDVDCHSAHMSQFRRMTIRRKPITWLVQRKLTRPRA